MTMRMLALAVVAGMLVSLVGCGLPETGTASRRRGLFQGRNRKRNDSELAGEKPGRRKKDAKPGDAGDPDSGIRRELDKLRAEETAQAGRVRELRSGAVESENQADLEEEKLDAIRQRIERYELALGERSRTSLPPRDASPRNRAGVDDDPYGSDLADQRSSRSNGRGRPRDEETLSAPRAYGSPPRAEVRNIPDPRQYSEDREVVVWQPPASPFSPGAAAASVSGSGAQRPSLSSMTAPTFPPPRPPNRQSEPAPAMHPIPPVAAASEIPYERREAVAPAAVAAPPAPIAVQYYEEPARSGAGDPSAAALRPPLASNAEAPARQPAAAPAAQSQSLRPPPASGVREEWSVAEPDSFGSSPSEVFVPDLYLGGGR